MVLPVVEVEVLEVVTRVVEQSSLAEVLAFAAALRTVPDLAYVLVRNTPTTEHGEAKLVGLDREAGRRDLVIAPSAMPVIVLDTLGVANALDTLGDAVAVVRVLALPALGDLAVADGGPAGRAMTPAVSGVPRAAVRVVLGAGELDGLPLRAVVAAPGPAVATVVVNNAVAALVVVLNDSRIADLNPVGVSIVCV